MSVFNTCAIFNLVYTFIISVAFCYNGNLPKNFILNKDWLKNMSLYQDLIKKHTEVTKEDSLTPEIQLHLITPNCDLWNADDDESPFKDYPLFAFYWAGGQALSRYILDHPEIVRDLRVLDIGSGCGATAIAAAIAGAESVTANDIDPVACVANSMNAQLNNIEVEILCQNIVGDYIDDWDCMFIGNMIGENKEDILHFVQWVYGYCYTGRSIYIGDPRRDPLDLFEQLKLLESYDLPDTGLHSGFNRSNVYKLICN